jgi:hypothetical protein
MWRQGTPEEQVEVVGLGAVQTPVRGPVAKKLIAVGRPAKFGRAEQTLTDTSVRPCLGGNARRRAG